MTFLMEVYHAIYYISLYSDAFSMNDVNKADMTEKESKINIQVKNSDCLCHTSFSKLIRILAREIKVIEWNVYLHL